MAKGKASKEGNDIGVDLASNIAKAITRVLSTYDFSPLNKNLAKGIGTIDVSSLIKSSDAGIKQLAVDIKSDLEKGVGDMSITPTLDVKPLEKAGDLVRTLINLTEQANKKTAITSDLYKKITDTANQLVASKRMEKDAAEDIAKAYQVKLPPLKLKAAVESVDTKSIEEQVKKIDLIGLQALVTKVDTTLIKEEVAKVNPVKLQANVLTIDTTPLQEAKDLIQQSTESAQELEQITNKTTKGRFSETAALSTAVDKSKVLAELEAAKIQPAKEFYNFLEKSKLTYKQLDDLVGIITGGQGELNRTYKSGTAAVSEVLEIEKAVEQAIKKSYSAKATVQIKEKANADLLNLLADKEFKQQLKSLTEEQKHALLTKKYAEFESNHLAKKQNMEQGYYSRAISSRRKLLATLQDEASQTKLHEDALLAINEHLQDGTRLLDDQAESIGATGKLQDFVVAQLKKGLSLEEIKADKIFYKTLKSSQRENDLLKERYQAQGELAKFQEKYKDSYIVSNQLMQETLQHSNLIFFKQVDVNKAVQDNIKARKDLIELAATEGEAGKSAMSLLSAELDLYKLQAEVKGYEGEAAKYVVEQLGKGKALSDIQKDVALETLETNEKSIDFRKKDLELQLLTTKRMKEIRESHDKIKDKIKQTLDFSKELAKDPKALGMFAAAQVGIGLHKANHAMHELVDSGMQAGEAIHVMADGISVMSVLGLSKVSGVNKEIIAQYGTMNVLTKDQRHTIGEMATSFGLAEQEAVNLTMAISRMPGESADTAKNFGETAKRVGQMKGVLPSAIMKEMAKNSGLMAVYSKGGAEGFAKAAASSKRMGIELSSVLNAAEKTLDFESSINAQMEASLLIGKSMNFDRLRAAALSGDANAIMEEQTAIMRQVGSLDNMNVLQKKKLAEAMGMTVEELTKFNEAQQMEQKYFGENATALDNVVGGVMKYGGAIGGFLAQNGLMILGVVQAITQLMTLRAMKIANTTATLTDTTVTNANTTAQEISAARFKAHKALRATGLTAQQAQIMYKKQDTLATTTNTGAVTGNTFATKISAMATSAWNFVKKLSLGILRMSGIMWVAEKIGTLASAAATGIATGAQYAWNVAKGIAITLWNSETVVALRNALAKKGSAAAEGLYNLAVGAGNMLKKTALGMWLLEKGRIIANTVAKWANVGATAAQSTANTTLAGTQKVVGVTGKAASGGLASFGAGLASLSAAAGAVPVILALGAAILMIGGGIAIAAIGLAQLVASFKELSGGQIAGALGAIVAVMAGFVGIVYAMVPAIGALAGVSAAAALPMLAFGAAILMVGAGVAIAALGMSKLVESFKGLSPEQAIAAAVSIGAMAAAFYFLTPALIAVATSATVAAGPLLALGAAVLLAGTGFAIASLGVSTIATSLMGLSATSQGLGLVGISLLSIATGLALMSYAGMAAMPIIGALVGLAAVAPALTALGGILGGEGGGGQATQQQTTTKASNESAKDDSMKILIDEIRGLRSEIAGGGVINMDGRKVGEVLRLVMNTSGVR